jgi:lipoate-protein ligase A
LLRGIINAAVCRATAAEEQDWSAAILREPVAEPALRVWVYRQPAVVLGCSGRLQAWQRGRAAAAGAEFCVRQSGGGAVLAGPWLLGASVVLPLQHPLFVAGIAQSFRWLGLAHSAWLQTLGIAAHAVPAPLAPRDESLRWACFGGLSHWEVVAGDGKIVGLAQVRRRNGILFSSGILIASPPWEVLCNVLGLPRTHAVALAERTSSCAEILGRPASAAALAPSLLRELSTAVEAAEPARMEMDEVE